MRTLIDVIQSLPIIIRQSVAAVSIHASPGEYRGTVHLAIHCEGDIGISLLDYAELKTQGITVGGFGSSPDIPFSLLGTTDIAKEIIVLDTSGLVGKINVSRFDTQDVKARLTYGYPSWIIKPNHLRSLIFWESGRITYTESTLGTTGLTRGELSEAEAIMYNSALLDIRVVSCG